MGKKFKNIDDLYRSELGGVTTEAPDFVKGNIDKALGFKRQRRGYFLLGLIALLTTGGFATFHFTSDSIPDEYSQLGINSDNTSYPSSKYQELQSTTSLTIESNTNDKQIEPTLTLVDTRYNSVPNHSSNTGVQSNINTTSTGTNTATTGLNSGNGSVDQTNELNQSVINNGIAQNEINNSVNIAPDNNEASSSMTGFTEDGSSERTNNESQLQTTVETTNGEPSDLADNEAKSKTEVNENVGNNDVIPSSVNNENRENEMDKSDNTLVNTPLPTDNGEVEEIVESNLETDSANVGNVNAPEDIIDLTDEELIIIDPLDESDYKPWMFSLTSGINLMKSAYTSNSMSEKTLYTNSTNEDLGNQTSLDATYRFKNGLTFGSGLGLVNFEENYDFMGTEYVLDSIATTDFTYDYEYIYDYYYLINIDSSEIIDSVLYLADSIAYVVDTNTVYTHTESEVENKYAGKNKATYFTLPIHMGTQVIWKKFQFDIFASARLNFLLRSSGGFLSENTFNEFGKKNSIYKPFYIDVMFASKIHYNFWRNLYITGTVQYRPVIGNVYRDVTFNKSFDYMHFGLGLSIKL